jgi:hypothetical protein
MKGAAGATAHWQESSPVEHMKAVYVFATVIINLSPECQNRKECTTSIIYNIYIEATH